MMREECMQQDDLLAALASGRWPEACDAELREHVAGCEECREVALVAGAFLEDRRSAKTSINPPPAGAVWWRMKLRLERESRETAVKTVGRVHGAVIAATVALLVVAASMTSLLHGMWTWLKGALPDPSALVGLASSFPLVAVAMVALLVVVLTPIAVYLAVAE